MDQFTINRYQRGGDIYDSLVTEFGASGADAIAIAAQSGDEGKINAAIVGVKYGVSTDTNSAEIFFQTLPDAAKQDLVSSGAWIGSTVGDTTGALVGGVVAGATDQVAKRVPVIVWIMLAVGIVAILWGLSKGKIKPIVLPI